MDDQVEQYASNDAKSMKEKHTEVLVVGAGPTGLLAAILLKEAGIDVQIIDREAGTAARSYACALHSDTLRLLDHLGLADAVLQRGRPVHKIAFHDGAARRAEIYLAGLAGKFPFPIVLPQSEFEGILEQRLGQAPKLAVKWNHRLDDIENTEDSVIAMVERLEGTATGYIVPHWETMVKDRTAIGAQFLVGADGHNSLVRHRLGIEFERLGARQAFVAMEFTCADEVADTLHVVLDDKTTNTLWPMPDHHCRWTFQLIHTDVPKDFPEKDRRAVPSEKAVNDQLRGSLRRLIMHRAPWSAAEVGEIVWCKQVGFDPCLASRFGVNCCWLAGDAAHQTGPVGMQSMNVGLREAAELAGILKKILRDGAPARLLEDYQRSQHEVWSRLLGRTGGLRPRGDTDEWVMRRRERILPCLPASGADLERLAGLLGMDA